MINGLTCSRLTCSADRHREGNVCVRNVRSCSISNGVGSQTWSGSAYRSCRPTSCSSGYVINGLSCSRITCSADRHREGNVCVRNVRSCSISNGVGSQTWSGSAYINCRPTSCSSGYVINGLTCSRLTCSADRHREGNVCVINVRSCSISNGVGSQTWSGSAYRSCRANFL